MIRDRAANVSSVRRSPSALSRVPAVQAPMIAAIDPARAKRPRAREDPPTHAEVDATIDLMPASRSLHQTSLGPGPELEQARQKALARGEWRVAVVSDTHMSENRKRALPTRLLEHLRGADIIVHAGDFTSRRALDELQSLAPVLGVRGNNDPAHLELPRTRRVELDPGMTLGVCHGDRGRGDEYFRPLDQFSGNASAAANALSHFEFESDVRVLIFGHSHNPMVTWHRHEGRRLLFLNPGSPTDRRWGPHFGCALLCVRGEEIEPRLWTW